MNKFIKKGFTLAEVMVALLIIAIILAASAPVITRSTIRTRSGEGNNPWEWIGSTTNASFNKNGRNVVAIIGSGNIPAEEAANGATPPPLPRLAINSDGDYHNHLSFYQNPVKKGDLTISNKGCFLGLYPAIHDKTVSNAIAIGNVVNYNNNSVAIGYNVAVSGNNGTAIGYGANVIGDDGVAIGSAKADTNSVVISGAGSAVADNSIAIGCHSSVSRNHSIALGYNSTISSSTVPLDNTFKGIVIGHDSQQYTEDAILIGHYASTVSGFYHIDYGYGSTQMYNENSIIFSNDAVIESNAHITYNLCAHTVKTQSFASTDFTYSSDARLKNIGSEYKYGMEKLNQLKVYNYTFKNEPKKKRVGVIAQDLMKIFPNAVSKDENGYYFIREEDIFYAMVNAIKELDKKISAIIESLKNPSERSVALAEKINVLESEIKQQKADIRNLKRRVFILKLKTLAWK